MPLSTLEKSLMECILVGDLKNVNELIEFFKKTQIQPKPRINALDDYGKSFLYAALEAKKFPIAVRLLEELKNYPDVVFQPATSSDTVFHYAVHPDYKDFLVSLLDFAVEQESDAWMLPNVHNYTLLHIVAHSSFDSLKHVIELIKEQPNGVDLINQVTSKGDSPAHFACGWGNVGNLLILIAAGASLETRNNNGMKPLELVPDNLKTNFYTKLILTEVFQNEKSPDYLAPELREILDKNLAVRAAYKFKLNEKTEKDVAPYYAPTLKYLASNVILTDPKRANVNVIHDDTTLQTLYSHDATRINPDCEKSLIQVSGLFSKSKPKIDKLEHLKHQILNADRKTLLDLLADIDIRLTYYNGTRNYSLPMLMFSIVCSSLLGVGYAGLISIFAMCPPITMWSYRDNAYVERNSCYAQLVLFGMIGGIALLIAVGIMIGISASSRSLTSDELGDLKIIKDTLDTQLVEKLDFLSNQIKLDNSIASPVDDQMLYDLQSQVQCLSEFPNYLTKISVIKTLNTIKTILQTILKTLNTQSLPFTIKHDPESTFIPMDVADAEEQLLPPLKFYG